MGGETISGSLWTVAIGGELFVAEGPRAGGTSTSWLLLTDRAARTTFVLLEGRPKAGLRRRKAEPFEPDPGHAGEGT